MSLFDDLFGHNSKARSDNTSGSQTDQSQSTKNTGSTNSSTSQNNSSNTSSNSTQNTSSTAAGTAITSTLDSGTQDLLKSLVPILTAHVGNNSGTADADLIRSLSQVAANNSSKPAISAEDIAGKNSAAVNSYNKNEAVSIGKLQQRIGSKGNTYSQQVEQSGQVDLAATLAGIAADSAATNKQFEQSGLQQAISGVATASGVDNAGGQNAIAQLMSVIQGLTGATTTTQTGQTLMGETKQATNTTTEELLKSIQDLLSSSTQDQVGTANTTTQSNTTGSQHSNDGILGAVQSVFNILGKD